MKRIVSFFIFCLYISCSSPREEEILIIDMKEILSESVVTSPLEEFTVEIKEIPLETTDSTLIPHVEILLYENGCFYIQGDSRFYIFDEQGRFVRGFGYKGEEGYKLIEQILSVPEGFILYDRLLAKAFLYDKQTTYQGNFKAPRPFHAIARMENEEYIGYNPNLYGKERVRLGLFEADGGISDTIFYPEPFHVEMPVMFSQEGRFYTSRDGLLFKEYFNDTIFSVADRQLHPRYFLDLGNKRTRYDARAGIKDFADLSDFYSLVPVIFVGETEQHLIFDMKSAVFYEKRTGKIVRRKLMYKEQEFIPKFVGNDGQTIIGVTQPEEEEDNPALILIKLKI